MIFKRQKILLALLEYFGGSLHSTDLQKYLFLFTRLQEEKSYHFVPYKFGCFSFQAYDDRRKLISKGYLEDCEEWVVSKKQSRFVEMIDFDEKDRLWNIKKEYGDLSGDDLIKSVYKKYPYFAINSSIADRILSKSEMGKVNEFRPRNNSTVLYTLGYEGRTLEEFLNILIKQDVKVLCDVRKNALSRKYGFSKKTLGNAAESLGIEYKHIPELGIESSFRKDLNSQKDYDDLFEEYEKDVLSARTDKVEELHQCLLSKKRIALTCFELQPSMCHRTSVAKAVKALGENGIKFKEF